MKIRKWTSLAMTMFFALTSCAINPHIQVKEKVVRPQATEPASPIAAPRTLTAERGYLLGYGDELEVKFFNNSEYNETVAVRPDGKISLQRVDDVHVVGMSVQQLDAVITNAYREILVNPDVTVFVRQFGGQQVYVMGEVQQPGSYNVVRGMSVLRAIAAAGGPLNSAKLNSVLLVRRGEQHNLTAERLDLTPAKVDVMFGNDLPIEAYDLIYIPKTFIADVDAWISQVYRIVTPPLDIYTRSLYYKSLARTK